MKPLAQGVSYIFHPFFVPFFSLVFLMYWPSDSRSFLIQDVLFFLPEANKKGLMIVIGTLTLAAPVVSILILYYSKIISSIHLDNKEERRLPYGLTVFYLLLTYFILYRAPENSLSPYIYAAIFSTLISLLFLYITAPFMKISAHMTAWGGLIGFMIAYLRDVDVLYGKFILIAIILIAGVVGMSRIFLKSHTPGEVYLGFLTAVPLHYLIAHYNWFIL